MALSSSLANCTSGAIPLPTIFGTEFLSVEASFVTNYTSSNFIPWFPDISPIDFCNVTLTHTHPGQNDSLLTQIWLPPPSVWNKRFQMLGGGGWAAGYNQNSFPGMSEAVGNGYATSTINAGVQSENPFSAESWALISPGNVDYLTLQNFASKALHEGALATKAVIESFYGQPATRSYWNGCSQGGRQGYMFAQRHPEVFDGIHATAPAINYGEFFMTSAFPQQVLSELGEQPHPCEFQTLLKAATAACDGLDGLIDGIISYPDRCTLDPYTLVGSPADCNATSPPGPPTISRAAAAAMQAIWYGFTATDGTLLFPGAGHDVNVTFGLLPTICSSDGSCKANRLQLWSDFIRLFLAKDDKYNINNMTREEYVSAFRKNANEYKSIMSTNSPDLTEFRDAGGKLLTFHGLSDEAIPYKGTRLYYDAVTQHFPDVHDFYRVFEAPGVEHCGGGRGGYPSGSFDALVAWVENGTVPDTLLATSLQNRTSLLCPYPKRATFTGQGTDFSAEDFECRDPIYD